MRTTTPQQPAREADATERRRWLSHVVAALGVSALGIAVAGALPLTTSAQTISAAGPQSAVIRSYPATTTAAPEDGGALADPRVQEIVSVFAAAPVVDAGFTGSASLRSALLRERAAQRAEFLAESAAGIARAINSASADARQGSLKAADLASQQAAAAAARESLRRAVAARLAATGDREVVQSTEPVSAAPSIPDSGGAASPVPGAVIGAHFGQRGLWASYHTGLDFRAAHGTPIRAVKSGVVIYAGNSGDWAGNHVAVRHADGMTTMSSHMSSMAVRAGQTVRAGQVIGYVGQTGRAFGAHLHFELYPAGVKYGDVYKAINPVPWLNAAGVRTR